MAVTITSNFGTEQEIKDALGANGLSVSEPPAAAPATPAQPETKIPEHVAEPGGEAPKAAAGETDATPEVATTQEPKPQEVQPEGEKEPSRGKFKAEKQKLRDRITQLEDERDSERALSARKTAELEESRAKLAELTKPAVVPKADDTPVEPKRPTRADAGFDDEKFDELLAKYDSDYKVYNRAVTEKTVRDALAAAEAQRLEEKETAERQREFSAYEAKRDAESAKIADYHELREAFPDKDLVTDIEYTYLVESEHPGYFMREIMNDVVNNGSQELTRIRSLHPVLQVRELTNWERRAYAEATRPTEPVPASPVVATAPAKPPEVAVPARPKPAALQEPIETLGSRSVAGGKRTLQEVAELAAAGDASARREYFTRRTAGER
jgi:hypothetical protein